MIWLGVTWAVRGFVTRSPIKQTVEATEEGELRWLSTQSALKCNKSTKSSVNTVLTAPWQMAGSADWLRLETERYCRAPLRFMIGYKPVIRLLCIVDTIKYDVTARNFVFSHHHKIYWFTAFFAALPAQISSSLSQPLELCEVTLLHLPGNSLHPTTPSLSCFHVPLMLSTAAFVSILCLVDFSQSSYILNWSNILFAILLNKGKNISNVNQQFLS